ncbi:DNA polymerase-3 subunit delta' [Anaerobium acetethylicum]|uniref:DNA polymerase III subunit delta' n=2 Tax=Anaerobium acetethylicum TaxID=1619234 RepID=A0A1D3TXU0_9FIRM|nr:DNA polymerase-3 subunit delta' [Anaerobium acetethylicum]
MINMPQFKDIRGHQQIIRHLQNAINLNKVSHAYIFNGEEGSGKNILASTFAMALQCDRKEAEPCLECRSCRQAENRNQPDIIRITHEKPNSIGVEDIRVQLNADIMIKPYSSPYKIYIIDEAEKLTVQAQNALLKTIEEPPAYAVIMLLTTNADEFLPTILSRCVSLNLKTVEDADIKKYLMEELQIPDYQADLCTAFAQGNMGKAIKLASAENFNQIKDETVQLLKYINEMEISEIVEAIKKISTHKLDVQDYFDLIMIWYRDVLLFKATSDVDSLIFKDEVRYIQKQANRSSYEGIEAIINALENAKARLNANVNFDLVMELLLLTIKEN